MTAQQARSNLELYNKKVDLQLEKFCEDLFKTINMESLGGERRYIIYSDSSPQFFNSNELTDLGKKLIDKLVSKPFCYHVVFTGSPSIIITWQP